MLNPDGVIVGNYRCNLNGYDLNRQWKLSCIRIQALCPEVVLAKELVVSTMKSREMAFFCDFHGHK